MRSTLFSIESQTDIVQQLQGQNVSQYALLSEASKSWKRFLNKTSSWDNPMKHKPERYHRLETVSSWTVHMHNYLKNASDSVSLL